MKNYNEVVKERFDTQQKEEDSIYSPKHPIGIYLRKKLYGALDGAIKKMYSAKKLTDLKLLDAGCGYGGMLDYFIAKGFDPKKSTGIDLSQNRIAKAKEKLKHVHFEQADITTFELTGKKFDLITSFDLFSHLSEEKHLLQGLERVYQHLEDDGYFLWYDIYADDHFAPKYNADSWGFSPKQMLELAEEAGFERIYSGSLFKNFFGRYHSVYQAKRLPYFVLNTLEHVLPGTPGNLIMVFRKKTTIR